MEGVSSGCVAMDCAPTLRAWPERGPRILLTVAGGLTPITAAPLAASKNGSQTEATPTSHRESKRPPRV